MNYNNYMVNSFINKRKSDRSLKKVLFSLLGKGLVTEEFQTIDYSENFYLSPVFIYSGLSPPVLINMSC